MGHFARLNARILTRVNNLFFSGVGACVESKCAHRGMSWARLTTDQDTMGQAKNTMEKAPERWPAATRLARSPRPAALPRLLAPV
jgi:hypothetical protein